MKKTISILLSLIMAFGVFAVSAGASLSITDPAVIPYDEALRNYEDETGETLETQRLYFQMPNGKRGGTAYQDVKVTREIVDPETGDLFYVEEVVIPEGGKAPSWYNEFNVVDGLHMAGVYWYDGPANCEDAAYGGVGMVGYKMGIEDYEQGIYYVDLPKDTLFVIFNNGVNGGMDPSDPIYYEAAQTTDINTEGAWEGDYESLPYGSPDNEYFDNCIYVIDPNQVSVNMYNNKQTCGGNWYVYYGNGCYGQEYASGYDNNDYPDGTPGWTDNITDVCMNPDHYVNGEHVGYHFDDEEPTEAPTETPTEAPTAAPTDAPTAAPTVAPTETPTHPAQGGDTVTLYFSNNKFWNSVNAYVWKEGGSELSAWPGAAATYIGENDYREGVYSVTVDTSVYDRVLFNGPGGMTVDIDVNGAAAGGCGIYCLDTTDSNGHYNVGFYHYIIENPTEPTQAPTAAPTDAPEPSYIYVDFTRVLADAPGSTWYAWTWDDGEEGRWETVQKFGYVSVKENVLFANFDITPPAWDNVLAKTVDAKVKVGDTLILLPEKDNLGRYTARWRSDPTESPTEAPTGAPTEAQRVLGDADGNGSVTIMDATTIQRHLADLSVPHFFAEAACVNGRELSILDATLIQRWIAGLSAPEGIGQPI